MEEEVGCSALIGIKKEKKWRERRWRQECREEGEGDRRREYERRGKEEEEEYRK